jgi:hypothetical protein
LLLLSFSVVLIHSMVPHHHHHGVVAESSASCCDEQQHSQNRQSSQSHHSPHSPHSSQRNHDHNDLCNHNDPFNHYNHHSQPNPHNQCSCDAHPNHCDAFNEITFFKSSGSRIDAPQVLNSLFQAAPGSDMLQLTNRSTDPGYYVPRTIQHIACPGGRSTSLRGPPGTA